MNTSMESVIEAQSANDGDMPSIVAEVEQDIREKILTTLDIYPRLARYHLQVSLGASTNPKLWKPILAALVREGLVKEEGHQHTRRDGRTQVYHVISRTDR